MALFSVDPTTCKRDGICVAECPAGLIEMTSRESVPTPIEGAEQLCIKCGHCVAVCPHGALSLKTMSPEQCPPVRRELMLNQEHTEHFLRSRRSIRTYKKKPVDRAILAKLIDMARYAPSGSNLQPVHWLVIETTALLRPLAGIVVEWMRGVIDRQPEIAQPMRLDRVVAAWERGQDRVLRGAPHLIVAYGPKSIPSAQSACIIALTYLELAASSLGLGACWAGYFNAAANGHEPMIQALALPDGFQCFGAMMVGYPTYEYHRMPLRNGARISWK
jgi:nitroreductase/NAD-dependent dihydropyrimidine dehydrogenase PreA subunit